MKNHKKRRKSKAVPRRRRGLLITATAVAVIVVAAAITLASKQLRRGTNANNKAMTLESGKKYVSVKVAGREVQVDPQTGQLRTLSADDAKQLADGLKTMLNRSTEGLTQVRNADGSASMDLQGRFQNVVIARVNADGAVEQSCVDEPLAAAQFFGIDPQLLGVESPKNSTGAVVRTPAKRVAQ